MALQATKYFLLRQFLDMLTFCVEFYATELCIDRSLHYIKTKMLPIIFTQLFC
jgi:hypothetical protein